MTGPQQERLRTAVSGANSDLISTAQAEWAAGARLLTGVAVALEGAAPNIHDQIGETGQAAARAFTKVAAKVSERSAQMRDASSALAAAHKALVDAEKLHTRFASDPLEQPQEPRTSPGSSTPEDVEARKKYDTDRAAYTSAMADREAQARAAADHMDSVYGQSTETMKKVHGRWEPPPPPPPPPPGGDGAGGTPPGGSRPGGGYTPGPGIHSTWHPADTSNGNGNGGGSGNGDGSGNGNGDGSGSGNGDGSGDGTPGTQEQPPGSAQSGTSTLPTTPGVPGGGGVGAPTGSTPTGVTGPTAGGLAGALGGGAMGGLAGISGAVRGPLGVPTGGPGAASAPGARIGSSARTGLSGALGRSTASGGTTGAAAGGARGAAGGATRGAGGRGTGGRGAAGSRGAAGGRGTAGSGSGRNKKDPGKKSADFFEEEQDWVDDEGAAPGVID